LQRLSHVRTRLHHRLPFRVGDAAGPRTFVEGRAVGVALTHPDPGQRDVHLGGHALLRNGVGARADIHRRTEDGAGAIRLGGSHDPGRAAPDLPAEEGDALATARPGLGLSPPARCQGGLQHLSDMRHPEGPASSVLLARTDQVSPPAFRRVHPQCPGQQVGMALEGKGVVVRPRRAKGPPRRGMGLHLEKFAGRVGDAVAPAHVVGGGEKGPGLHGAIGATGVDRAHRARGQTPVASHA